MSKSLVLRMACLDVSDREWILAQLSAEERAYYQPLLEEAVELGLDRDPSVLSVLDETLPASTDSVDTEKLISQLLGNDLSGLAVAKKRWQQIVLSGFDENLKSAVIEKLDLGIRTEECNFDLPPELHRAVCKEVLRSAAGE